MATKAALTLLKNTPSPGATLNTIQSAQTVQQTIDPVQDKEEQKSDQQPTPNSPQNVGSSKVASSDDESGGSTEREAERAVKFKGLSKKVSRATVLKAVRKKSTRFFDDDKDLAETLGDYVRDEWVAKLDDAARQAKKDAHMFYHRALKHIKHLPPTTPLVLSLQLNLAVYHAEVKKDLNTAIESVENVIENYASKMNVFAVGGSERKETERIINLMSKNMAHWNEQAD